ncbi:PRTRC system ThiF family protein [Thioalkalivibrio sp. ALE19]|uniref:PRTRC system ThiF family protein n=1 Tax=Thioalkalivibrio sp. ALE19 TaxID=1266909 RepID=UPI00048CB88A|nr:PRTRC system ThiF family protein [Thioalkalivibrio sp. ALE19]
MMTNKLTVPDSWLHEPIPVTLVGAGGTGSEVLDGLVRMHHGLVGLGHPGLNVRVYDGDTVSASNIGRQRFGPRDVGQNKAVTLVSRYNLFFGLDWEGVPMMADPETLRGDRCGPWVMPLLVTCVDRASFRVALADHWTGRGSPMGPPPLLWLDMGNGQHRGQVVLGHLARDDHRRPEFKLPHIVDLYPEMRDQPDDDAPSCSMAEALASQDLWVNKYASMGLSLIWSLIREGEIDHHGMFFDSRQGSMQPLHIDPATWSMFGYTAPEATGVSD